MFSNFYLLQMLKYSKTIQEIIKHRYFETFAIILKARFNSIIRFIILHYCIHKSLKKIDDHSIPEFSFRISIHNSSNVLLISF